MAEHTPSVGDFVIYQHAYGFDKSGPISRVTANSVFVPQNYSSKDRRVDINAILFVGDENSVSDLTERLRSSASRHGEEVRSAGLRRKARDLTLIEEARAALPHTSHDAKTGDRSHG